MNEQPDFSTWFHALWGHEPFPWQRMLAKHLADRKKPQAPDLPSAKGKWPQALDLPTAAGKTACIDIALYALAAQAERHVEDRTTPRRIWFVVDRRIVVDAAFERAQIIASHLQQAETGALKAAADRLFAIGGTTRRPLATARLRGGVLHDDGWAWLPSQPAVITSTVDQIGSRLLFRGYGRSGLTAPIWAGLAAHDSLIILDEAHLSMAFLDTLAAVARYRGPNWAHEPLQTPFAYTMLSATPPDTIPQNQRFPGLQRDAALAHSELDKRLGAAKPAELIEIKGKATNDPLVREATRRACTAALEDDYRRVAIIVNRVATAQATAAALREAVGDGAHVVLLTGRLRPLHRDRLLEGWHPVLRANAPERPDKPVIVVATQTIEVGADFSFDALITEAASLDALRQRFGRLNRLGRADTAPGAVLVRAADTRAKNIDPVYGTAIAACWGLLTENATQEGDGKNARSVVDFGIAALDAVLARTEDLGPCLAPTSRAPTLLPAHLDLLCQTAPTPAIQPDASLYLHGAQRGSPEVRVVWRADLASAQTDRWAETVALCPPNSVEALSIPLHRLRCWLADVDSVDDAADVEGATPPPQESRRPKRERPMLIWRGRERSRVTDVSRELRPNDLVILPADYGMTGLGQVTDEASDVDIWETSHEQAGRRPTLRLQRRVLKPWLGCPPLQELLALAEDPEYGAGLLAGAIERVLAYTPEDAEAPSAPPDWWLDLLRRCNASKTESHPAGGLILFGPSPRIVGEQDVFADDDDLLSAAGRDVSLAAHSAAVERAVGRLCEHCLPAEYRTILASAGYWHDAGKCDERFQVLLRQGDEPAAIAGQTLAKSSEIPDSSQRRHEIRQASRLPAGFRHEMLSLQLAERAGPCWADSHANDLRLHAIASHHGHGRPFAPVVPDADPPSITRTQDETLFEIDADTRARWAPPQHLVSGIPQRFWRLTRRHGWWGLAYLEAMVRLGDWYASQWTTGDNTAAERVAVQAPVATPGFATAPTAQLELTGIDGTNPLGFLAAIGALNAIHESGERDAQLHWTYSATWNPVVSGLKSDDQTALADAIADTLRNEKLVETGLGITPEYSKRIIDCKAASFADLAIQQLKQTGPTNRRDVDFLASFASDGCEAQDHTGKPHKNKAGEPKLTATPFQFTRGSGQQFFLGFVYQLSQQIDEARIAKTLFHPWRYSDPGLSMRWDPIDARRYALMDRDPTATDNKAHTDWMANLLAYRGLTLFTSAPGTNGLVTTGWPTQNRELCFTWPLWSTPCDADTIRSLLVLTELYKEHPDRNTLRARGIDTVFRARRIKVGAGANFKLNFSPAKGA